MKCRFDRDPLHRDLRVSHNSQTHGCGCQDCRDYDGEHDVLASHGMLSMTHAEQEALKPHIACHVYASGMREHYEALMATSGPLLRKPTPLGRNTL
jgi:hypothetical protein